MTRSPAQGSACKDLRHNGQDRAPSRLRPRDSPLRP
ncbi:Malolactic regulator [Lacticaseibacillus rhamnosus]|nr:Malolactic regulator [Lacticaseibacillus rhamnosus]QPB49200.1 Malolactic regulator [Lacticaseibacillus rhamnosus]